MAFTKEFQRSAKLVGLTPAELAALGDWAHTADTGRSERLTRQLQNLEAKGLVTLRRSHDARFVDSVRVTPRGLEIIEDAIALKHGEKARDNLAYDLRMQGEAEMRRRIQDAEARGIFYDHRRPHFVKELERAAAMMKPDAMRKIRADLGWREAEFRFGLAFEAARQLKNLPVAPYNPTPEQEREAKESAERWLRGRGRDPRKPDLAAIRLMQRKYGLTLHEAKQYLDRSDSWDIEGRIDAWRAKHGFPATSSPLVRGIIQGLLKGKIRPEEIR